jgi:hypothetical protein
VGERGRCLESWRRALMERRAGCDPAMVPGPVGVRAGGQMPRALRVTSRVRRSASTVKS